MVNSSGAMAAQYVYTPYGVEEPYNASTNPYRYTGRRLEAEWGIFNYRARYYDPALGRFYQTDPVLYADQFNLYAYVGNDPLNRTDPTGRTQCKGMHQSDCDVARDAAEAASRLFATTSENLENLANAVEANDGLNNEQQELLNTFEATFDMDGTVENLRSQAWMFAEASERLDYESNTILEYGDCRGGAACVPRMLGIPQNRVRLDSRFFSNNHGFGDVSATTFMFKVRVFGHEGGHLSGVRGGSRENEIRNDRQTCFAYPSLCATYPIFGGY